MVDKIIHFVGGFGKARGKALASWELAAINSAVALNRDSQVLLHTTEDSWHNAPPQCEVLRWDCKHAANWATWECKEGAHMSDRVRLLALQAYGGVYLDTDCFSLQPIWKGLEQELASSCTAACPIGATKRQVTNNIVYAKKDSDWLCEVLSRLDNLGRHATKSDLAKWDFASTKLFSKLFAENRPDFQALNLDKWGLLAYKAKFRGVLFSKPTAETLAAVNGAYVVHAVAPFMSPRAKRKRMDLAPQDSLLSLLLEKCQEAANGAK
jgi:hypothetical protein